MTPPDSPLYGQYPSAVIVPAYELTDTALKLSRVIEREANRRSAVRGNGFRVEQNFPVFQRMSSRLRSSVSRSKRSVTVAPTMDPDGMSLPTSGPSSLVGGPLEPIPGSPRASVRARLSVTQSRENSMGSEDSFEPMGLRERVWVFFDDPQSSVAAYYFSISLFFFISMSTVIFIAQTEKSLDPYKSTLDTLEAICAGVFTVEYGLRALSAPSYWSFVKNIGNWVDLAAILPFYLEAIVMVENAGSFGAIRIVRLTRVARVLKMSRYSSAIQVFVQAIAISIKALSMLLFLMGIAVVVFSSAIYFAEFTADGCRHGGWIGQCNTTGNDGVTLAVAGSLGAAAAAGASVSVGAPAQCVCVDPNPYSSIASSFWWSIVTMSTVGYGDMTPVTVAGRIVGMATILTGMLVLALPITVIGTNFQKVMKSVMQQTMKNNVDYLKGKKQICRQEIKAILQRFHAVTEDIHLSIDDVIAVYDTDNSGTLEDDELRRFRHDLEMLQNRAYMNMNMDLGTPTATALAVASPNPSTSSRNNSTRLLGTMMKKLSKRGPSLLGSTKLDEGSSTTPSPSSPHSPSPPPVLVGTNSPFPSPAKPDHHFRSTFAMGSTASPMVQPLASNTRPVIRNSRSQPSNLLIPPHGEALIEAEKASPEDPSHTLLEDIQGEDHAQLDEDHHALSETTTVTVASGPNIDELLEEEMEHAMRDDLSGPELSHLSDSQPSSPSHSPTHHHRQHQRHSHHHSHGHHAAPRGVSQSARASSDTHDVSDDDVFLMRLNEMQRTFEDRLKETEARLDIKLLNLTKILLRVENLIEMAD